jgi:molecular chaperone GrpE
VDIDKPQENSPELSDESGVASTLEAQLAAVTAERDQLASEKAEIQDRLLRARAEFDNFRKRTERERSDYIQYSAMEMVKDILPVLDDFERALSVETTDSEYAKGVELIYQRMLDSLTKMGLEPIDTEGQQFDPNLHQAVERVPSRDVEDQAILGEFQRGYNFKGRLLRPAMVRVAVRGTILTAIPTIRRRKKSSKRPAKPTAS